MIYLYLIDNFVGACQAVKYLTAVEFWDIARKTHKLPKGVEYSDERIKLLRNAIVHYSNLRKLDKTGQRKYRNPEKLRVVDHGEGFLEYWWDGPKGSHIKMCGYWIKGLNNNHRCLREAGTGTFHKGYGYCMQHEALEIGAVREGLWANMRRIYKNVPTMGDILKRAEQVDSIAGNDINGDIVYMETARQLLMDKISVLGSAAPRELINDLSFITEASAKVKALKAKVESINAIPASQVGAMIVQVLRVVTEGENDSVKKRIAQRALELQNILVPTIDNGKTRLPVPYTRSKDTQEAIRTAAEVLEDSEAEDGERAGWANHPSISGYEIPKPPRVPNYKKNHPYFNKPKIKLNLSLKEN